MHKRSNQEGIVKRFCDLLGRHNYGASFLDWVAGWILQPASPPFGWIPNRPVKDLRAREREGHPSHEPDTVTRTAGRRPTVRRWPARCDRSGADTR